MAVNPLKIRLGAADLMYLFNTYDLGASVGGVELNYNPTTFQIEIDQSILPVAAFKTKEELTFDVAIVQTQMNLVSAAFGYASATASGVTTNASGTLAVAPTPTLAVVGTGAAGTYSYQIVAFDSNGDGVPSTTGTTSSGPTSLSSTNYIAVTCAANVTGAAGYRVIRTAGGASQGQIAIVYGYQPNGFTVNDTGLAATTYATAGSNPAMPNTDVLWFGGNANLPTGPFDFAIPKNDGTANHLRGHINKVYSAKAIKIDGKRDKQTELNKLQLMALADTTQVIGKQAGFIVEEY